jgi:hypothetical protein
MSLEPWSVFDACWARILVKLQRLFTPWVVIPGTGQSIGLFNLLAIGGKLLGQASAEHRAEARGADFQPCLERLAAAVANRDVAADFSSAIANALRADAATQDQASAPPAQAAEPGNLGDYRLTTVLRILRLRESGLAHELALEVGLDVRLEAADRGRIDYYTLLVYAPEPPTQNPHTPRSPLYSRLLAERATPRPVSQWCDDGGPVLLDDQLSVALTQIATQVAHDLH